MFFPDKHILEISVLDKYKSILKILFKGKYKKKIDFFLRCVL